MNTLIRKLLRESLLDEDYNSIKEINELASEIYKHYCKLLSETPLWIIKKNLSLPDLYINDVIDLTKYDKLDIFRIYPIKFKIAETNSGVDGQFQPNSYRIVLGKNYDDILTILFDGSYQEATAEQLFEVLYYGTYKDNVIAIISHELQHAYDEIRSYGKFSKDKKSKQYYSGEKRGGSNYLKLHHEIIARLTESLKQIDFYILEWETRTYSMKPFNEILTIFKRLFYGWDEMSEKVQKMLIRRLSQYYHKAQEELPEKNAKMKKN